MADMKQMYAEQIVPKLMEARGYTNGLQVPRMVKIVVNMGFKAGTDRDVIKGLSAELAQITGQKPVTRNARKSVANFKLRAGMPIGTMVTLRGRRMYDFFERLIHAALPRIRDFRGLSPDGFDGRGNYSLGLVEQTIFPEIDPDEVKHVQGLNVTIVTTAKENDEARDLLRLLGMPFAAQKTA
ncbi:MAG: 50S ribosomal protein L5 [Kiritimatiellae bacterium]|nr:50S ribosomal protein L5 [Kiritimatiellia bacterium]